MKIYTKKGDQGDTFLLGGSTVKKNHFKLDCYGTIDELNAFIGNIYDQNDSPSQKKTLFKIQNQLFNIGSCIAFDGKQKNFTPPNINEEDVLMLEKEIDQMDSSLPSLNNFILPSGHPTVSKCHIGRTVCRRAERKLVSLSKNEEVDPLHLKYLNRLSDYLFVLSRFILNEKNIPAIKWEKD